MGTRKGLQGRTWGCWDSTGGAEHQGSPQIAPQVSRASQHLCWPFLTLLCFPQSPLKPTGAHERLLRAALPASPSPRLGQQLPWPEWVMSTTCHPNSKGFSPPAQSWEGPSGGGNRPFKEASDRFHHTSPHPSHRLPRRPLPSACPQWPLPCSLRALNSPGDGRLHVPATPESQEQTTSHQHQE